MKERLDHIRSQTRRIMREYRAIKATNKNAAMDFFYLTAEGIMTRRHLESMIALYRKATHDFFRQGVDQT